MAKRRGNFNSSMFQPDWAMAIVGLGTGGAFFAGLVLQPAHSPSAFVWASALGISVAILHSQLPRPKNIRFVRTAFIVELLITVVLALALPVYFYLVGQLLIFWYPAAVRADWNEPWQLTCGVIGLTSLFALVVSAVRFWRHS